MFPRLLYVQSSLARRDPGQEVLRFIAAACALLILSSCGGGGTPSSPSGGSGGSGRLSTIVFSGRFDMTNLAVPQRTPHSYTYHVEWRYQWDGSWDALFTGGRTNSGQMSFPNPSTITGTVDATYRNTANGPDIRCSISLSADQSNPPMFVALYNASQNALQITNADAPTFRFTTATSSDPNCLGGPGVNIFGAPADWNPLGNGGGTVSANGGSVDFDRRWQWTHTFAGGEVRNYDATIHSTLQFTR